VRDFVVKLRTATTTPRTRVRYLLAFTSGMRDGELSALTWADVDLDAPVPTAAVTKQVPRT
jgi:integrase